MITYNAIGQNKRRSVLLIFVFLIVITILGYVFARAYDNPGILLLAVGFSFVSAFVSYFFSDSITLAISKAQEIDRQTAPDLFRVVENLTITAGLPLPRIYIIDDTAPNAFATGRDPNHASVAVTQGLLNMMTDTELEGVIAHELGHVKNYDIRVAMIVFGLVAAISLIADILLRLTWFSDDDNNSGVMLILGIAAAILAPIIAVVIQMAVSRKREYLADATGALTTRYPEGLASALAS
jgi:heat shock protein HtpX